VIDPTDRVKLGRTALQISRLGFGSAPLGGLFRETSTADATAAVEAAFAAGLCHFDVAPQYGGGLAERRLGAALSGFARQDYVVSTKIGKIVHLSATEPALATGAPAHQIEYDYSYNGVRRSLDSSLERLGLERVDVVFIHDVNRKYHGDRVHERLDEALSGACRALVELRDQGVIGAFGPATKDVDIAQAFVEQADIDCLMLPARCTLLDQTATATLLPRCETRGIAVLAAAPFDSGILASGAVDGATYDYVPAPASILERVKAIEARCADFRIPLAAAALQYPLRLPAVASVVTGMRSASEVRRNIDLMRIPIPPELWIALEKIAPE
jgi:D-threo-aldose 1-dehydrogenase